MSFLYIVGLLVILGLVGFTCFSLGYHIGFEDASGEGD